ncbi:hypothetical protein ACFSLT_12145 [Novosphingobium resinovorum]
MILVDSNILIDAIEPHSPFHDWSSGQLMDAVEEGAFINPIVVGRSHLAFPLSPIWSKCSMVLLCR